MEIRLDFKPFGKTKKRWCFRCRKYVIHDKVLYTEKTPCTYDPFIQFECRSCHEEHLKIGQ